MLESIITILLMIILSPVILFAGFIILGIIVMLLALILVPIIAFVGWVLDLIFL